MKILIDCDSLACKAAGIAQWRDPETTELEYLNKEYACGTAKNMVENILELTPGDVTLYFTKKGDTTGFRKKLYPDYKVNRKGTRPYWEDEVRAYLISKYPAEVVESIEADDAVCMEQYQAYRKDCDHAIKYWDFLHGDRNQPSIIWGIDKDLETIPGLHGNYNTMQIYYLTPFQAFKSFYKQVLEGDRADNVPRICKRWNSVKAFKKIEQAEDFKDVLQVVIDEFKNTYADRYLQEIQMRGELLHLLRAPFDKYNIEDHIKEYLVK